MRFSRWIGTGAIIVVGALPVAHAASARSKAAPPDLNLANDLMDQAKYVEAAAIQEQWLKLNPKDADGWFHYGYTLELQASASEKPAEQKKLRKRAREALLKAKKLRSTHAMLEPLLEKIRPDGTEIDLTFSAHEKAAALMKQAETAFVRHDYDAAYKLYQETLALEPSNYYALLYSGDVHFNRGQLEEACAWFAKAVAADPNLETAHRYWGDATRRLGKHEESLSHHIDAFIAQPLHPYPRKMLGNELQLNGGPGRRIPLKLPQAGFELKGKQINLSPTALGNLADASYTLVCAGWRLKNFQERHPTEKTSRHCIEEEVFSLEYLLEARESKDKDGKQVYADYQTELELLAKIKADDLLAPFAFFERGDDALHTDYPAYRDKNREQLRRYVRTYWFKLPPEKPAASR